VNPEILARYAADRLRVVRQVRYSLHNENCTELVLFLNVLPVATVELKTNFTQSVQEAVDQYRFDRLSKPKGLPTEALLSFQSGALVHFAVSNDEVQMTTRLDGPATRFLPFNKGDNGAAGNRPNPKGSHRTAYLWEEVWARQLAGGLGPLPGRGAGQQEADPVGALPALSPVGRHTQSASQRV
jgi:type I restriction enzyme R subunit